MTNNTKEFLIWQAITPIHSGTGQGGAGIIDLPIAREVATQFPILPASSIKGVLRDGCGLSADQKEGITKRDELFGYTNKKRKNEQGEDIKESRASRLTFTDARLLLLPVRSYKGVFAYLTCPLIIQRLQRDMTALGLGLELPQLHNDLADTEAHLAGEALTYKDQVLFEDIDLKAVKCNKAAKLAEALAQWTDLGEELTGRLAVVSNNIFGYFAETSMEVTAHIALDSDTKTVKGGALWYEEALPAQSVLSSFLLNEGVDFKMPDSLQIGGKGSVGRGLLSVKDVTNA